MATRPKTTSKKSRSSGKPAGGAAANGKRAHGNGANGNGANGNGAHHRNGNGNGRVANVSLAPSTDEARRIATEMGGAILVASSLETAQHSDDVELIADAIGEHMGLSQADRADIQAGARLHDIGKASIPRDLLDKPSTLTEAEWEVMRTHTIVGAQILGSVRELEGIADLVRHSHERWDGEGYPDGLAGDDIPLGSRIIFCADAFHAIRSDRPYRDGVSAAEAMKEVQRCAGSQFDPLVVEAFEEVVRDLRLVDRPARRSKRSSRLTALLLCLALGGGGSAIGGSGLLDTGASEASAPPVVLDCGLLYCHSIYPSTLPGPGNATASSRSSLHRPGATVVTPGLPVTGGGREDGSHDASVVIGPADGGQGAPKPGGDSPAGDPPQGSDGDPDVGGSGGTGSSGGGSTGPTATAPSKDKNPNSPGNGWGPPSTRPDEAPGPGNAGGNGNGQGGSAGAASPGNSGNAPGHNKPPKS